MMATRQEVAGNSPAMAASFDDVGELLTVSCFLGVLGGVVLLIIAGLWADHSWHAYRTANRCTPLSTEHPHISDELSVPNQRSKTPAVTPFASEAIRWQCSNG